MSEMVARIMKHLDPWIAKGEDGQKVPGLTEAQVLRILEIMRQPTGAMIRASCAALSPGKRPDRWLSNKKKHALRYRAMIDAATGKAVSPRDPNEPGLDDDIFDVVFDAMIDTLDAETYRKVLDRFEELWAAHKQRRASM